MLRESVRSVGQQVTSDQDALLDFSVLRQSVRELIYVTTLLLVAATPSPCLRPDRPVWRPFLVHRVPPPEICRQHSRRWKRKLLPAREAGRFADAIALYRKGCGHAPGMG